MLPWPSLLGAVQVVTDPRTVSEILFNSPSTQVKIGLPGNQGAIDGRQQRVIDNDPITAIF